MSAGQVRLNANCCGRAFLTGMPRVVYVLKVVIRFNAVHGNLIYLLPWLAFHSFDSLFFCFSSENYPFVVDVSTTNYSLYILARNDTRQCR